MWGSSMDTFVVPELLIAVTSLVEHLLASTEDLKVKAAGCGTGFGFFKETEIEPPCPWLELGRPPLEPRIGTGRREC